MVKVSLPFSGSLLSTMLLISVLSSSCSGGPSVVASEPPPLSVELTPVESGDLIESSEFVGTLEAQERVLLRPEIQGRIAQILVVEGQLVSAGEPVIQLEPDRTQAQLDTTLAQASAARAARASAQDELAALHAERLSAAADLEFSISEYQRFRELARGGAVSFEQFDQKRQATAVALARLRATEQRIESANSNVEQLDAEVAAAKAQVASASVDLGYKQVVAPISGAVGNIPNKVGDYVGVGETLTTITRNEFFNLNVSIPTNRANQLKVGLAVELIDPDSNQVITQGRINFVNPEVDQENQSILAKFTFPNEGKLREGQFVRARVIWQSNPGVLVPTTAVTLLGGQAFVFVAEETTSEDGETRQVARQKPIELGPIQGQQYQVISGVKEGDTIITSRILDLVDGSAIVRDDSAPDDESNDS